MAYVLLGINSTYMTCVKLKVKKSVYFVTSVFSFIFNSVSTKHLHKMAINTFEQEIKRVYSVHKTTLNEN